MGRTKVEKQEANKFIMKFIASDQAWSVALQLMKMPKAQNMEYNYFIGAQAIY